MKTDAQHSALTTSSSETGAVLPIVALLIVILLVFAAFTVDLGAAWAERRQDQTAADAAAMAGAIEYVRGTPSEADIVVIVKDYVQKNIGYPADAAGWGACPAPTDGFVALPGTNCVSLKQASTDSNDTLLRVDIPVQPVETAFARLIGVDTIDVSAFAIARIESTLGVQGALPFILPLNPGDEYCLGTPPSGQAREVCEGPSEGFFGSVDSPYFGAGEPWDTTSCQDSPTNNNERIAANTALGIDHYLRRTDMGPPPESAVDGADVCDAATSYPGRVPHAIVADQGSLAQASAGFIGAGPFGTHGREGRLRQSNPKLPGDLLSSPTRSVPQSKSAIQLDNVGLWEYLDGTGVENGSECHRTKFEDLQGAEATEQLLTCLDTEDVLFTEDLLTSPRFALVPQINVNQAEIGNLGPNSKSAINIVDFVPVYLQASWYNCSATECMYFDPPETPDPDPTTTTTTLPDAEPPEPPTVFRPEVFEPGESDIPGCVLQGNGCSGNVNLVMEGISALVLDKDNWLPDSFDNQFGDAGAFNVYLSR